MPIFYTRTTGCCAVRFSEGEIFEHSIGSMPTYILRNLINYICVAIIPFYKSTAGILSFLLYVSSMLTGRSISFVFKCEASSRLGVLPLIEEMPWKDISQEQLQSKFNYTQVKALEEMRWKDISQEQLQFRFNYTQVQALEEMPWKDISQNNCSLDLIIPRYRL